MLIAPSNNVADHLATSMQEVVNDAHPKQPIMVTRCHSFTTEESQVWHQAGLGRPPGAWQSTTGSRRRWGEWPLVEYL
jgi:hypothetical protein